MIKLFLALLFVGLIAYYVTPESFDQFKHIIRDDNETIINNTQANVTIEEQSFIVDKTILGRPTNVYGSFDCRHKTDCEIYFDCITCQCDVATGYCYEVNS